MTRQPDATAHPVALGRVSALVLALGLGLSACADDASGTGGAGDSAATESSSAPPDSTEDSSTEPELPTDEEPDDEPTPAVECSADVTEAKIPAELSNLSYPDRTIVYGVEVLGENGVRLTGVTDLGFDAAREQMRRRYSRLPFDIVDEDIGAGAFGANWTGPSITGRWLVSDVSAVCAGETEVRILWTADG